MTEQVTTEPRLPRGRNVRGQFLAGNTIKASHARAHRHGLIRALLRKEVTDSVYRAVLRHLVSEMQAGKADARALLLEQGPELEAELRRLDSHG